MIRRTRVEQVEGYAVEEVADRGRSRTQRDDGTDDDATTKGIQEISFGGNAAADWFFDYEAGVLFWTNENLGETGDFQGSANFGPKTKNSCFCCSLGPKLPNLGPNLHILFVGYVLECRIRKPRALKLGRFPRDSCM